MKKYLIIFITSFMFSQGVGLNLSLIGHLPQEEFKTAGVTTGFGIDFNILLSTLLYSFLFIIYF